MCDLGAAVSSVSPPALSPFWTCSHHVSLLALPQHSKQFTEHNLALAVWCISILHVLPIRSRHWGGPQILNRKLHLPHHPFFLPHFRHYTPMCVVQSPQCKATSLRARTMFSSLLYPLLLVQCLTNTAHSLIFMELSSILEFANLQVCGHASLLMKGLRLWARQL